MNARVQGDSSILCEVQTNFNMEQGYQEIVDVLRHIPDYTFIEDSDHIERRVNGDGTIWPYFIRKGKVIGKLQVKFWHMENGLCTFFINVHTFDKSLAQSLRNYILGRMPVYR